MNCNESIMRAGENGISMFGTLIGIFLTSAGVVIGADSAFWGAGTPPPDQAGKVCVTGPRSAATLQGWYGEGLYLHKRFHEICRDLARSSKSLPLEAQADRLARKLEQAYREHTGALPRSAASLPPPSSRHVAYVAVAGFEAGIPLLTVRDIRWERQGKGKWRLTAERASQLIAQTCGVRFLGEDAVAKVLLDKSARFQEEKRRPEVRAGSLANQLYKEDDCIASSLSIEGAKALYRLAVRLTIDHGEEFAIENGAVGGRLHLLTILPDEAIEEESIDPEQYVGELPAPEGTFSEFAGSPEREGGESS